MNLSEYRNKRTNRLAVVRISLLLLLFIPYIMFAQFAIPQVVLCVGANGHVAVESAETDWHGPEHPEHQSAFTADSRFQEEDCRDYPLQPGISPDFSVAKVQRGIPASIILTPFSSLPAVPVRTTPFSVRHPRRLSLPSLQIIDTTVLLI